MLSEISLVVICLFILVFCFDVSFNIRRMIGNLDRIWRKLSEINERMGK